METSATNSMSRTVYAFEKEHVVCCTMKETTDLKVINGLLFLVEQHFNQKSALLVENLIK